MPSLIAGRVPIAVLLGLAGLILFYAWRRRVSLAALGRGVSTPLGKALIAMFALWLICVVVTIDPSRSWRVWASTAALVAGGALLTGALRAEPRLLSIAQRTLVAGALVAGLIAVAGLYIDPAVLDPLHIAKISNVSRAAGTLRGMGSVAPCLAAVVLWAGWRMGGGWRAAGVAFLPIALGLMRGSDSHAGMLGMIAAVLALGVAWLYLRLGRGGQLLLIAGVSAAALAAAVTIIALLPVPPYHENEALHMPVWLVDAHRQLIWGFAWHVSLEHPWLGYGLDTAGRVPGAKDFLPGFGRTETMPSHAHNWMLELLVESGVIGLGAALVALGVFTRRLLHAARRGAPGAYAAIALAGAYFGSNLVNFSVWSAWWQATFVTLLALALAADPAPGAPQPAAQRARAMAPAAPA
ncbi:MAG TPA: O-antigen ligase family protein [Alphaproteobacteria bacterium]|nr:O-antigen ligase family protein [Alphaproteobacteria bacterium]